MFAIRAVLGLRGHHVRETSVDGPAYGNTEARRRMVMVATSYRVDFEFTPPAAAVTASRLGELLETVADNSERWKRLAHLDVKDAKASARGTNFRVAIVDERSETVPTIGAGYARSRGCEPLREHPTRPGYRRLLTPTEHARVKGIPVHLIDGLTDVVRCIDQRYVDPTLHTSAEPPIAESNRRHALGLSDNEHR